MSDQPETAAGPWVCAECGQKNAGWSKECGRCESAKAVLHLDTEASERLIAAARNFEDDGYTVPAIELETVVDLLPAIEAQARDAERGRLRAAVCNLAAVDPAETDLPAYGLVMVKRSDLLALLDPQPWTHQPVSRDRTPEGWRCTLCGQIVPETQP